MPWTVDKNEQLGLIETVYRGPVTAQVLSAARQAALALATGEGPHWFLADIQDAELQVSVVDIYEIPSDWDALGASRSNRLAVVIRESSEEQTLLSAFYEDVTVNRGWRVKVFPDRESAIAWLTAP